VAQSYKFQDEEEKKDWMGGAHPKPKIYLCGWGQDTVGPWVSPEEALNIYATC